jgi:hypothetical protein
MRLISLLSFTAISAASTVFQLNSTSYYSPDLVAATLHFNDATGLAKEPLPITYIFFSEPNFSVDALNSTISGFLTDDDVFSERFLTTLVLGGTGAVTKVYRLYWDHNLTFLESVTEGSNGTYIPVTGLALTDAYGALSIAVPSRLYYPPPTKDMPLSGKRLGVKDIYDLKDVRTGGGNRAYRDLAEPAPDSAQALQKLIDMGAVVIGKTKTTQFALGERPTADYVDQLAPSNPRGDGYQHPQGSSAGTGAGLTSYQWMDIATGSDTGGSVRLPAMANGMRISNASLPLGGILPISAIFDTPGVLARSAKLLQAVHKACFPAKSYIAYPKRIVLPEECWPRANRTLTPSCESTLVLYPMGAGTEDYRDVYPTSPPSPIFGAGLPGNQMAVMAALPDCTVPIGERTYLSRVTVRNETLPVTIGIIAAAGCDMMLMDLVVDLADEGIIKGEVKTGSSMY